MYESLNPFHVNWDCHQQLADEQAVAIENAINELTPDYREILDKPSIMTGSTQNDYGRYLSLFGTFVPDNNAVMLYVIGHAMARAGGNKKGIAAAMRILGKQ